MVYTHVNDVCTVLTSKLNGSGPRVIAALRHADRNICSVQSTVRQAATRLIDEAIDQANNSCPPNPQILTDQIDAYIKACQNTWGKAAVAAIPHG